MSTWKTANRIRGVIHNCDTLIVNMRDFVEFFFNLCVFPRWSSRGSQHPRQQKAKRKAYTTPPGWRFVLLTVRGIIVLSEHGNDLERTCFHPNSVQEDIKEKTVLIVLFL